MNKSSFDMATTAKAIKTFHGMEGEDVSVWIRDVLLVAEVMELTEEETLRIMLISMRDTAMSCASQTLKGHVRTIKLDEMISLLKKDLDRHNGWM